MKSLFDKQARCPRAKVSSSSTPSSLRQLLSRTLRALQPSLVLIAVVVAASLLALSPQLLAQRTISVSLLVDSAGPAADTGMTMKNAAAFAARDVSHDGEGPFGKTLVTLPVEYAGDARRAEALLEAQLRDVKPVAVIGPCDGATAERVAPICRRAGVPLICPVPLGPASRRSPEENIPDVLPLVPSLYQQLRRLLDYAEQDLRARTVGLYYSQKDSWQWVRQRFDDLCRGRSFKKVFNRKITHEEEIATLSPNVEVLLVFGERDFCVQLVERAGSTRWKPTVLVCSQAFDKGPSPRLAGAVTVGVATTDVNDFRLKRFRRKYRVQHARVPGETALLTYDAVKLVAALLEQAGEGRSLETVIERGVTIEGLTGPIRFDSRGRDTSLAIFKASADSLQPIAAQSARGPRTSGDTRSRQFSAAPRSRQFSGDTRSRSSASGAWSTPSSPRSNSSRFSSTGSSNLRARSAVPRNSSAARADSSNAIGSPWWNDPRPSLEDISTTKPQRARSSRSVASPSNRGSRTLRRSSPSSRSLRRSSPRSRTLRRSASNRSSAQENPQWPFNRSGGDDTATTNNSSERGNPQWPFNRSSGDDTVTTNRSSGQGNPQWPFNSSTRDEAVRGNAGRSVRRRVGNSADRSVRSNVGRSGVNSSGRSDQGNASRAGAWWLRDQNTGNAINDNGQSSRSDAINDNGQSSRSNTNDGNRRSSRSNMSAVRGSVQKTQPSRSRVGSLPRQSGRTTNDAQPWWLRGNAANSSADAGKSAAGGSAGTTPRRGSAGSSGGNESATNSWPFATQSDSSLPNPPVSPRSTARPNTSPNRSTYRNTSPRGSTGNGPSAGSDAGAWWREGN